MHGRALLSPTNTIDEHFEKHLQIIKIYIFDKKCMIQDNFYFRLLECIERMVKDFPRND
jgi:hypothetical protein